MKIIVVAHNKGGVGKSTIALNIGYAIQNLGHKAALLDTDSQGTTTSSAQNIKVYTNIDDIDSSIYEYLIIDTPPYLTSEYSNLFLAADIVIIPSRPNPADVIEIEKTVTIFKQVKYKNIKLQGFVLFNANDPRTAMVESVRGEVESIGLPILETIINNRVTYARSLFMDNGVFSDNDPEAKREITNLTQEIISKL